MNILEHLKRLEKRFNHLEQVLGESGLAANSREYQDMGREHARLSPVINKYQEYLRILEEEKSLLGLSVSSESELRQMAEQDLAALRHRKELLERDLWAHLLPPDPNARRNILLEIRAGTGGDEAGLFAADLLRMYSRYAENHGWRLETLASSLSERGGIKEVIVQVSGPDVWNHLKYERGVHRVQRVPITESSGRVHTSTATVAVLPEAEEVDVQIHPADLRIDTYRSSGAGGQHVNKTDSAVRITHLSSGMVVACQDERSQIKNRAKAMKLLRSRLLQQAQEKHTAEISRDRRSQVGTGDRSEKIRTYNFPQNRVTDHRINVSIHNLPAVLEGQMDELVNELQKAEQSGQMLQLNSGGTA